MFNAKKEKNNIVNFIKDYFKENNLGGVVLGISGGKDSGVVAALFCEAIGPENVVGITMPCHSIDEDKKLAQLVANHFKFKLINIDLTDTFDTFKNEIEKLGNYTEDNLKNSDINLKPRLRMSTNYYIAALYSSLKRKPYIVAGTSNKCELYVGYFTKGGDSVHDISPIADLTVEEVIKVGEVLGVPKEVLYRTPSDGLSELSDEDKLGVKYSDIAKYMKKHNFVDEETRKKIERLHNNNLHKFNIPTYKKEEQ